MSGPGKLAMDRDAVEGVLTKFRETAFLIKVCSLAGVSSCPWISRALFKPPFFHRDGSFNRFPALGKGQELLSQRFRAKTSLC